MHNRLVGQERTLNPNNGLSVLQFLRYPCQPEVLRPVSRGREQTYEKQMDIATYRLNWPRVD